MVLVSVFVTFVPTTGKNSVIASRLAVELNGQAFAEALMSDGAAAFTSVTVHTIGTNGLRFDYTINDADPIYTAGNMVGVSYKSLLSTANVTLQGVLDTSAHATFAVSNAPLGSEAFRLPNAPTHSFRFTTITCNTPRFDLPTPPSLACMCCDNDAQFFGLNTWDVSNVEDFSFAFANATNMNTDVAAWDTAAATDMESVFDGATAFNQDISGWNTAAVTTMRRMFRDAHVFDQAIGGWNVSAVENTSGMFQNARTFRQDLSTWNVSAVQDMSFMFAGALSLRSSLTNWDVSTCTTMEGMFQGAIAYSNRMDDWDVSAVTNFDNMFDGALRFHRYNSLLYWQYDAVGVFPVTSLVDGQTFATRQELAEYLYGQTTEAERTILRSAFTVQNQLVLGQGGVHLQLVDLLEPRAHYFLNVSFPLGDTPILHSFETLDEGTNTLNVVMFLDESKIQIQTGLSLREFPANLADPSKSGTLLVNATNMPLADQCFRAPDELNWVVHPETITTPYFQFGDSLRAMFLNAKLTVNTQLVDWDTSLISDFEYMFDGADPLLYDISYFDVSNVSTMDYMFRDASYKYASRLAKWENYLLTPHEDPENVGTGVLKVVWEVFEGRSFTLVSDLEAYLRGLAIAAASSSLSDGLLAVLNPNPNVMKGNSVTQLSLPAATSGNNARPRPHIFRGTPQPLGTYGHVVVRANCTVDGTLTVFMSYDGASFFSAASDACFAGFTHRLAVPCSGSFFYVQFETTDTGLAATLDVLTHGEHEALDIAQSTRMQMSS